MKKSSNTAQQVRRAAAIAIAVTAFSLTMPAAVSAQQSFKTPEDAFSALIAAAGDPDNGKLTSIFGPGSQPILSSGDSVADKNVRDLLIAAYNAKHQVTRDNENQVTLTVGQSDWPFPIPLVRKNDTWRFDLGAGRQEVLARRIGRNERSAILVALAYVDAQFDYADADPVGDGQHSFAQRFVSSPGKKDGLYWPTTPGATSSPLGPLAALASLEGYRAGQTPTPYHGYYYKILTGQGPNAQGGTSNYLVKGNLIGGFGLVAYPAQYGNSGVMTFMVNHQGVVLEKDLGPNTTRIVGRMTSYNPDQTWRKAALP